MDVDASASAVGFSMNMREIAAHLPAEPAEPAVATVIATDDKGWHAALEKLRLAVALCVFYRRTKSRIRRVWNAPPK